MGMPAQGPLGITKEREVPPTSFGPPYRPLGFRVSTTRHGTTVMKWLAAEGTAFTEGCSERSAIRTGSVSITFVRTCSKGTAQSFSGTASSSSRCLGVAALDCASAVAQESRMHAESVRDRFMRDPPCWLVRRQVYLRRFHEIRASRHFGAYRLPGRG